MILKFSTFSSFNSSPNKEFCNFLLELEFINQYKLLSMCLSFFNMLTSSIYYIKESMYRLCILIYYIFDICTTKFNIVLFWNTNISIFIRENIKHKILFEKRKLYPIVP